MKLLKTLIVLHIYFNLSMADSPGKIDLYRVPLNDLTKKELLLNDIFEVGRMVFDNGNFIVCTISGSDGPMSAVTRLS